MRVALAPVKVLGMQGDRLPFLVLQGEEGKLYTLMIGTCFSDNIATELLATAL